MGQPSKLQVYGLVMVVLIVVAVVVWKSYMTPRRSPPSAPGYYTGPMKAKGLDSWGTDDGRSVPPPPGYKPSKPDSSPRPGGAAGT